LSDPGADSQRVFRALLKSMSRPGLCVPCPARCAAPAPLASAVAAAAACLLDRETALWLDDAFDTEPIRTFLRFYTGATLAKVPRQAAFALIGDALRMPRLDRFALGSSHNPEASATLIIQLASLHDGGPVEVAGPGINGRATMRPLGLPAWFWDDWRENHGQFARGIDAIMTDGSEFMSLPRTTHRV